MSFFAARLRKKKWMPHSVARPADIEALYTAFQAASAQAESLFSTTPAPQLEQAPAPGSWSAAQCLAHLAATNLAYVTAMRAAVQPVLHLHNHERSGPIRPGFPTRWFLSNLEPPARRKVRAPGAIQPAPSVEPRLALKEFIQSQSSILELLDVCGHLDLNRIRFANPFIPGLRFTVGAGFLIVAAHNRRHLWQATMATSKA